MGTLERARRHAPYLAAAVLAVSVLAGCGGAGGSGSTSPKNGRSGTSATPGRPTTTPSIPSTPTYQGLRVGSQPYVNACQAYFGGGGASVYAVFDRQILLNAVIQETYAENSLPASWYPTPQDKATSSCSIQFADPPWSAATVIFTVEQYGSAALAKTSFAQYTPLSKADLDKANKRFGTTLSGKANYSRIPGLAATFFQASSGGSFTLDGNKIIGFNLGTSQGKAANTAILRKAVPVALKQVASAPSKILASSDFGKRIGAARYGNPCEVLTPKVFRAVTGLTADPTSVDLTYNGNAVSHRRAAQADGVAHNDCRRTSLQIGKQPTASISLSVRYYDSAAQARRFLGVTRAKEKGDVKPVSGFGPDAFLFTFGDGTTVYTAVGPYVLVMSGTTAPYGKTSTDMPTSTLTKLYSQLAPTLTR